ncbi:MAG: alkyldihydroxyacetonephosphate synthase, partial [Solirubrobacteraceae bacterium]|nr:alkyldihydroxyacetonephosphate synthase [Solirubrobacteraceae bacterium]
MAERSDAPAMRWWGWGDPQHPPALPAHALAFLRSRAGIESSVRAVVALEAVRLPPSRLSQTLLDRLRRVLGSDAVRDGHRERVLHAAGKGYPDLVRMRSGEPEAAPDAVLLPSSREHVRAVLDLCAHESVALVPFGGGTSVVGGVAPLAGEHAGVVSLDMGAMGSVTTLDRDALTVTVQGGIRAPALERYLAQRGLTLGHFPQSYEYVSLGGAAATRSAGQASTGYGSIEKMVLGMRFAAPAAELELAAMPASAAGPSVRALLVGSEGALGVFTELDLRLREAPRERSYEGVFFESFAAGVQALRTLARAHALPDVARLSDEQETSMSLALAGTSGAKAILGRAYLRLRGYSGGCLAIVGFEGAAEEVAFRRGRARPVMRAAGGLPVGHSPGAAWLRSRFEGPYLRDELLSNGVMVETLETAAQWSRLHALHREVGRAITEALRGLGTPGIVMCHVSHVYETGASLYFTFI